MKRIILLVTFASLLFAFALNAQDCNLINDIKHSECHQVYKINACNICNLPTQDSISSWDEQNIIELTTSGENHFIRFYRSVNGYDNKKGRWMVKRKDVSDEYGELLPGEVIKDILQITYVPDGYVIVEVPPGTRLIEGAIMGSSCKTCRQFCILEDTGNIKYYPPPFEQQK